MVEWEDQYSIGIKEIDNHHKKLFEILNDLTASIEENNEELLIQNVDALYAYTQYHFNAEEALMKKFNYPGTADHINKHSEFKSKILEFKSQVEELGPSIVTKHIVEYLTSWLANHILEEDTKVGQCQPQTK